ncbi:MAG: peptidoglycan-binding protein [Gemmobacter sp.]|nr:peptidoglycan-binding protein [Gemmobacter sp.]
MFRVILALALAGFPVLVSAENRALVIGNANYRSLTPASGAEDANRAVETLRSAGFRVDQGRDLTADQMRAALSRILQEDGGTDRLVVLLSGHFARSAQGAWFLGVEASDLDLGTVGGRGVDLDTVMEIAAQHPGGALVILGGDDRRIPVGAGLGSGIGMLDVPQGVTVIRGTTKRVAEVLRSGLLRPGAIPAEVLAAQPEVSAEGYLSMLTPFLPGGGGQPDVPVDPAIAAEMSAWQSARNLNTIIAYEAFLRDWPRGRNAGAAQDALARLRADPQLRAQEAEAALGLSRDSRRNIQGALSLLGYDTRGVDGIFGAGTRDAIRRWQQANGIVGTGYITADQMTRLSGQADRLAAERAAAAEARRRELERADRAFWTETGTGRDEAGLRAYLDRYPDGVFADVAETRLASIEDQRQRSAAARERTAWQTALGAGTVIALQGYLREFPKGAFSNEAKQRIEAMQEEAAPSPENRAAREAEAALGLNPQIRQEMEERLLAAGFDPGRRDGVFDAATRRAIRQYQEIQGRPVTGYLDPTTIAMLMLTYLGRKEGP